MNQVFSRRTVLVPPFSFYAWSVVAINLLVIMWGAYVRATGSGAGCGNHWPLCNGAVVPRSPTTETVIELSHRVTSGMALLAVLILVVWAFRRYPKSHLVRQAALWSMIFMIGEALIGAGLVLFEYVAMNVSIARVIWIAAHLANTFLLLAALTLTAFWSMRPQRPLWRSHAKVAVLLLIAAAMVLLLGAGGAVTALGDTLVTLVGEGAADSQLIEQLVALRVYHPLWAIVTALVVGGVVWSITHTQSKTMQSQLGWTLCGLYGTQLVIGALNVYWKAPIILQLIHLLFADLIWITFVLFGAVALAYRQTSHGALAASVDQSISTQQTLATE